jgi:hypothetical protein
MKFKSRKACCDFNIDARETRFAAKDSQENSHSSLLSQNRNSKPLKKVIKEIIFSRNYFFQIYAKFSSLSRSQFFS